jgi:hypothetical protein
LFLSYRNIFRETDYCERIYARRWQSKGGQPHLSNRTPDGLTIRNFSSAVVSLAVLGESGVLYDIDKFFYLGSPYSTYHAVFVTRKQPGLNSVEKLRSPWTKNRGSVGRVFYLQ